MKVALAAAIAAILLLVGSTIGDVGHAYIGDSLVPAMLDCAEDEVIATTPDGVRCVHTEQVNE